MADDWDRDEEIERLRLKDDDRLLNDMERQILKSLGCLGRGIGLQGPENKYWQRAAQSLVAKGFVEEVWGYYAITEVGRSVFKSNSE